ncbi:MAG: hypothetical protein ACKVLC_01100 [Phycisphaerales bacterium]|jgi:hypothetical protein|tara:strand:- start:228 stop:977 length:750 start_codon:yes stop_codon:yes gene_type:complete
MMNQSKIFVLPFLLAGLSLALIGCGGGESEDSGAPVAKKRPTAPPKPVEKTVEQLTANLNIDDRIVLDEQDSPRPENQRIAILSFFDAMLAADSSTLKSMLAFDDQLELKAMMDTGFAEQMDEVSLLMLKTGDDPDGSACVMAIYEIGLDYQVQLWFFDGSGSTYTFTAADTQPNLVDQLSGNWVSSYFDLKKKQAEIAQQPDEETSYTLAGESTSTDGSLGGDKDSPGGPGPGGPGPSGPSGPTGRPR